jgi:hypothetical protein
MAREVAERNRRHGWPFYRPIMSRRGSPWPEEEVATYLLDHLIGECEHVGRNLEAQSLGGLEVDDSSVIAFGDLRFPSGSLG